MNDERTVLQYGRAEPSSKVTAGVRIFPCVVLGSLALFSLVLMAGAVNECWELLQGDHHKRYWAEYVRGDIGLFLIGGVLLFASTRWLRHVLRGRSVGG